MAKKGDVSQQRTAAFFFVYSGMRHSLLRSTVYCPLTFPFSLPSALFFLLPFLLLPTFCSPLPSFFSHLSFFYFLPRLSPFFFLPASFFFLPSSFPFFRPFTCFTFSSFSHFLLLLPVLLSSSFFLHSSFFLLRSPIVFPRSFPIVFLLSSCFFRLPVSSPTFSFLRSRAAGATEPTPPDSHPYSGHSNSAPCLSP